MTIVGGFDVHRAQITFDYLDTETGAVNTGQIRPATRLALRRWLAERFAGRGDAALAVECCTGWRFVVEELVRAGVEAHLAEPADTATLRGAQAAREDRPHRRAPPPGAARPGAAARVVDPARPGARGARLGTHVRRSHGRAAGLAAAHPRPALPPGRAPGGEPAHTAASRAALAGLRSRRPVARRVATAWAAIASLTALITPLRARSVRSVAARSAPGPSRSQYGIGALCAVIIWAELGDPRRFRSSDQAVRFAGLDVTVWSSDERRSPGRLARQGSPELRWALFEAGRRPPTRAPRPRLLRRGPGPPGRQAPGALGGPQARPALYHTLRELGDAAWVPTAARAEQAACRHDHARAMMGPAGALVGPGPHPRA